ncbi:MAG: hypothetical protein DI551_06905 [Micavibrio aeruginosavorus]|uniref:TauD/TfdA-like domain-containing protein n=1 Tax=Micavibrio aeruginosavorus TaxID=349221 RepID=A0A2W5MWM1_9BACT|nr:MAG: hypothetical protein DI551_06905 [Micavibrio aeruginosavorus]
MKIISSLAFNNSNIYFDTTKAANPDEDKFAFQKLHSTLNNDAKIQAFRGEVFVELQNKGFVVLKSMASNDDGFMQAMCALSPNIFYAPTTDYIDRINVAPFMGHGYDFSETTKPGFFHTDFCSYPTPPRYVALQCLEPDPRHPYYGRNQITHINDILSVLKNEDEAIIDKLRTMDIHYSIGTRKASIRILNEKDGVQTLLLPHAHMISNDDREKTEKILGQHPVDLINQICLAECKDIALDLGDIVVLDNYTTVHRRGECTIKFENGLQQFSSRKISTIRFF